MFNTSAERIIFYSTDVAFLTPKISCYQVKKTVQRLAFITNLITTIIMYLQQSSKIYNMQQVHACALTTTKKLTYVFLIHSPTTLQYYNSQHIRNEIKA